MSNGQCIVCGKHCDKGIEIRGKLICSACEQEIVSISVLDKNYTHIKHQLKRLWESDGK